jgi:predicted dehydrogenase
LKKIKIGIIGLIHDHVWDNFEKMKQDRSVSVSCVSDVNEPLLKLAKEKGIKKTYNDFKELLRKEDIDAIAVYKENSKTVDVVEIAAERGIHVMVEKPMAATLDQAVRMKKVSDKFGIKLMVNFPTTWSSTIRLAGKLAKEGAIGNIYELCQRTGHEGPKEIGCSPYFYNWLYDKELNGAGAYIDFCCYGVNHSRWILGLPEKVTGLSGTYVRNYLEVDDNACLLLGYKKAMATLKGTWSNIEKKESICPEIILRGDEGTITVGREVRLYGKDRGEWQSVEPEVLPKGFRNGPEHFVRCIREEKPFIDTTKAAFNVEVQAILEAGLISIRENRTVFLKELLSSL